MEGALQVCWLGSGLQGGCGYCCSWWGGRVDPPWTQAPGLDPRSRAGNEVETGAEQTGRRVPLHPQHHTPHLGRQEDKNKTEDFKKCSL